MQSLKGRGKHCKRVQRGGRSALTNENVCSYRKRRGPRGGLLRSRPTVSWPHSCSQLTSWLIMADEHEHT